MTWLPYGLDAHGDLIHIDEVRRGKTALGCPYCGSRLTARKSLIKGAYFTHMEATCRAVGRRNLPTIPYYNEFDLGLSRKALAFLYKQWEQSGMNGRRVAFHDELHAKHCIYHNQYHGRRGAWAFTKLGKLAVGALSMRLFAELQDEHIRIKLSRLDFQNYVADAEDKETAATDLHLYQHQYQRLLSSTLYLVAIQSDEITLHKLDVTRRPVEERLAEIERDLSVFLTSFKVQLVDTWPHQGAVEFYFQHRYRTSRYDDLGSLTNYFQFADPGAVTRDLRRMKAKELDERERELLEPRDLKPDQRSSAIRAGMQRAAAEGVHIGRPTGAESTETFLGKPSSQRVIAALAQDLSLRQAAAQAGVSVGTVRKVKALLQENRTAKPA